MLTRILFTHLDRNEENDRLQNQIMVRTGKEGKCILLADDNEVNQTLLRAQITNSGYKVDIADDGLEAIAKSLLNAYDLILMDMDMPRMGGISAVRFLREHGIYTPVAALTGNVSQEDIDLCLEAGCQHHLAKPLDIKQLVMILDSGETHHEAQPDSKKTSSKK